VYYRAEAVPDAVMASVCRIRRVSDCQDGDNMFEAVLEIQVENDIQINKRYTFLINLKYVE